MIANPSYSHISPEEYLEAEEVSPIKHEYRNGQVYAMAGASNIHVIIAGNLFAMLRNHVRGRGCQTYIADTKAHIESIDTYYYPDVMVSCDRRDREFNNFLRYPCLIVEVLSSTTEAFDRGDKFSDYRQMESLQEYVLISQTRMRVECFRRNAEGLWVLYPYDEDAEVHLASVDFRCAIADIYEDVTFPSSQPEASK
ncbi:Uma2 family endonuclease [Funiculus sociatus GB2-A5]|uniref:Uma2 family endonuclease n=1 Tax=Funiculus sociatus GB2-A5 TaxID=2933946 RepID=A0ABV0JJ38_9CYAN|nr:MULTISPECIES: Uma2 family endonuclease [unclassified Trichocoleus]MBD1907318.1 Uma2 family endonuclease [Trichocoleus sp. FACHB-832]MBD2062564.1 Uma2 family endonuclease [Trichocoleus sp. FACHB-6]